MRRIVIGTVMALSFFVLVAEALVSQSPGDVQPPPGTRLIKGERQGDNVRMVYAPLGSAPSAPDNPTSFLIDSPTVSCHQPDPEQDACYINWYQIYADTTPNYMIAITLTIGSRVRAFYGGFFQTSMHVPFGMHPNGFKVPCGTLGAGGNPGLGNAYGWNLIGRSTTDTAASFGTVYCPAYQP